MGPIAAIKNEKNPRAFRVWLYRGKILRFFPFGQLYYTIFFVLVKGVLKNFFKKIFLFISLSQFSLHARKFDIVADLHRRGHAVFKIGVAFIVEAVQLFL